MPEDSCPDCDPVPGSTGNLINKSTYFVAYHYLDFLGRGPDTGGLKFWRSEMENCGADAQCREVKRINVSAAFFQSIEFQETGFLAYRMGLASFGEAPKYRSLMADSRSIAAGVQVGIGEWKKSLAENRRAFADGWVNRQEFRSKYGAMTDELNSFNGDFVRAEMVKAFLDSDEYRRRFGQ